MSFTKKLCVLAKNLATLNTLRSRQNGFHFADYTFKRIILKEKVRILIKISLKFVSKSPIDNIPALFQMMAWHWPGNKPLSEAMMVSLLTHICVAWPQWVNSLRPCDAYMCLQPRPSTGPVDNRTALVQIMACHLFGAKPLSNPMMYYYQLDP